MIEAAGRHGGYDEHEFIAELYDLEYSREGVFASRPARMKDVGFFVEYSKLADGETLELGCGTGRVLIPTASAGCRTTGLDLSKLMLKKCSENLAPQPATVRGRAQLTPGDMTDIEIICYLSYPDGRTERLVWSFPMRYFFRYEVEHLLELSGFRLTDLFGDFDRSGYSADSPEMVFVAEKNE